MNVVNSSNTVRIPVERCRDGIELPRYANEGDAGADIYAASDVDVFPGQTVLIPTGLKFAIPNGYELQIRPRSGLSLKTPLRISNSPGTVDSGFREEVGIIVTNTCLPTGIEKIEDILDIERNLSAFPVRGLDEPNNGEPSVYSIRKGDRIAQIVLAAVPAMELFDVESITGFGADRKGGFGSTGVGRRPE